MKLVLSLAARWAWLPLAGLAAACDRPEAPHPPANLLTKEQVTRILVDTHLLESRLESSRLGGDSARALFLSQYREILRRYHVSADDSAFERSYRYYAIHDKDLEGIYTVVIDSLNVRATKMGVKRMPVH